VTDQIAETTADSAEPDGERRLERDGAIATDATGTPDLTDPDLYVNRELSWLDFNDRVLQLAEDESIPLLERLKFLSIFVTNLDEFFMIRVAGVHDQVDARIDARGPDGLSPTEVLRGIHDTVREQDRRHASLPARTPPRRRRRSRRPSASRSSPCSPPWPWAPGGRSRTSPTSR
jgi:polyphosphate kinase